MPRLFLPSGGMGQGANVADNREGIEHISFVRGLIDRSQCGTGHDDEGHDKTALIEVTIAAQAKQTICLAG